jgi:FkbM family methyltransferase
MTNKLTIEQQKHRFGLSITGPSMMKSIQDISFNLVDIGAMGGTHSRWEQFPNCRMIGFEPDPREFKKLKQTEKNTWIQAAVFSDDGEHVFYQTRVPCNGSLLRPNRELIKTLSYEPADFDILEEIPIKTTTLDKVSKQEGIRPHFVKLDTQGSELDILKGSKHMLGSSILGLEVEVEFLPLYQNQPLFEDVLAFLRSEHFQLMDIGNGLHVKFKNSPLFNQRKSNFVSADALFLKSVDAVLANIDRYEIKDLIAIIPITLSYGYFDYSLHFFRQLEQQFPQKLAECSESVGFEIIPALKNRKKPKGLFSERKLYSINQLLNRFSKSKPSHWLYGLGNFND